MIGFKMSYILYNILKSFVFGKFGEEMRGPNFISEGLGRL